jgi:hypothetical protein
LQQANDLWAKASSDDPDYTESLDLLALLLHRELKLEQWRTDAAPLVHRALQIRDSHPDTSRDDLALALELQADTSEGGREGGGASFWRRATEIRADNIAAMQTQDGLVENVPAERVGGK